MRRHFITVSAALLLVSALPAAAQSTFATLVGTVADGTGGVLPGATITATHLGTAAIRTTTTDTTGTYQLANLDTGRYRISVALSGFAGWDQEVDLLARQTARLDARLQVAGSQESIDVTADAAPVITTENATIDTSKSGEEISRLALNFRASNATSPIEVHRTVGPGLLESAYRECLLIELRLNGRRELHRRRIESCCLHRVCSRLAGDYFS